MFVVPWLICHTRVSSCVRGWCKPYCTMLHLLEAYKTKAQHYAVWRCWEKSTRRFLAFMQSAESALPPSQQTKLLHLLWHSYVRVTVCQATIGNSAVNTCKLELLFLIKSVLCADKVAAIEFINVTLPQTVTVWHIGLALLISCFLSPISSHKQA